MGILYTMFLKKVCEFSRIAMLPDLMEKLESVQYSAALAVTGTWKRISRKTLYNELAMLPDLMEKPESVQYSAALAVTGTWKRTSRKTLYNELGWESLNAQRWCRRLTLFFKYVKGLSLEYTSDPIPLPQYSQYNLRKQSSSGRITARTDRIQFSFSPSCTSEWNKLEPEVRLVSSPTNFKNMLLSRVCPSANAVFGIYDPIGLSYLTQLIVDLNNLNLHKFQHKFKDTLSPMCPASDGVEDVEHFLLQCLSFAAQRQDLLAKVAELLHPFPNFTNLSTEALVQQLAYGDNDLPDDLNRTILQLICALFMKQAVLARIMDSVTLWLPAIFVIAIFVVAIYCSYFYILN